MSVRRQRAAYRVTLEGVERLEDMPLRDIAAFLDGIVALVARGAAEVLRRPIRAPGRYEGPIEEASRFRLARLASGSVVADLLPAPTPHVESMGLDVETLSETAFGLVIDVASGDANREHPALAKALTGFFDRFAGRWPTGAIRFEDRRARRQRAVVVDARRRDAILEDVEAGSGRDSSPRDVSGRLFEANVETESAQVRTPSGEKVDVRFDPELEPEVRRLLGNRATLRGDVSYDPKTKRAKAVHIREIVTGTQLGLDIDGVDFWTDRLVSELISEIGATSVEDPAELEVHGVTDKEWAALYEVLGIDR